jgi:phosphate transport system substrate-binding protein
MRALSICALLAAANALGCKAPPKTETLLIAGSSSMRFHIDSVVKGFVARNPTVSVVTEGGGSTGAIVALKHGAIDIADVSRTIAAKEDDSYLRDYLVARDGIAMIVNPANPVTDVTSHQLSRIFRAETTNWAAVGGSKEAIALVNRDAKSHLRRSLEDMVLGGEQVAPGAKTADSAAQVLEAVRSLSGAIGYVTLRSLEAGEAGVKVLKVDGVEMSRPTMLSGRYPLARSFYLVVHMKSSPVAERFIDYALSKEGQEALAKDGLLEVF